MVDAVSLREAGRRLCCTCDFVKGAAQGMGIPLVWVGRSLCMSERDFRRLSRHLARLKRREPASA